MIHKKLISLLVLLMAAVSGAWAQTKTWETLAVGDVIKVGDQIHNNVNWSVNYIILTKAAGPFTLVRADISGEVSPFTATEKADGAYYVLKFEGSYYQYKEKIFPVTAKSDGLVVTAAGFSDNMPSFTLAVHEIPDYAFTVADSEHGSGNVKFYIGGKKVDGAYIADEGKEVTMTITPDASWVVDGDGVKAQAYTTWGAAGAPRRNQSADPEDITILGDVTLQFVNTDTQTGARTYSFTMPSASVLVSTAYKKMGTLYFDPADKTDLMEVKVGDEVKAPANGRLRRILEGTAVKLTANKGYQLRKVVVKKNVPIALNINNPAVGQYIGTDGKNYAYASLPPGVSTIAKICYVNGNHGLALALEDEGQMDWNTAITEAADHTPKVIGGTWKLASKDEWQQMINAADNFENLADGFTSVGGTNMSWGDYVFYWLNTERSDDDAYIYEYYEDYSFQMISYFGSGDKNKNYIVRACLEF